MTSRLHYPNMCRSGVVRITFSDKEAAAYRVHLSSSSSLDETVVMNL